MIPRRRRASAASFASGLLLLAVAMPLPAQGVCGDCNSDGVVDVLDALTAAQHSSGAIILTGTAFTLCDVSTDADVDILDALTLAQQAVGLVVWLQCGPQTYRHLLMATGRFGMTMFATIFFQGDLLVDSFDSRVAPYSPMLPLPPFTMPHAGNQALIGANEFIELQGAGSEVHGQILSGPGQIPTIAGLAIPAPTTYAAVISYPIDVSAYISAFTTNDNALINLESTFAPGGEPFDPAIDRLATTAPGTIVRLGDPTGATTRVYWFDTVYLYAGPIEFVGPTIVVINSYIICGGVGALESTLDPGDVEIHCLSDPVELCFDLVDGFSGCIYAPRSNLILDGDSGHFRGSIYCHTFYAPSPSLLRFHYDEALATKEIWRP